MAKKSGNKSNPEMKEDIARSREELALRLSRVREEIDLPRKIRRSVQREPIPWIIGAIAIGLVATAVVTRKKKVIVDAKGSSKSKNGLLEAGFVLGALRIAAGVLQPVVMNFVEKKLGTYSSRPRAGPKGF